MFPLRELQARLSVSLRELRSVLLVSLHRRNKVTRDTDFIWFVLAVFAIATVISCSVSTIQIFRHTQETAVLAQSVDRLTRSAAINNTVKPAILTHGSELTTSDFTAYLPSEPQVRDILAEIERSASERGVIFGGLQRKDHLVTDEQLASADLVVSLRGGYPPIKAVVLDVLGRFSNVTLSQWRLRRASPADTDATVSLAVWAAPHPAASPVRAAIDQSTR